ISSAGGRPSDAGRTAAGRQRNIGTYLAGRSRRRAAHTIQERVRSMLYVLIVGFVAGMLARLLSPGPNNPGGFILTTVLGIVGAFVATFIGQAIGWYRPDQGAGLIGAVIGALIVLFIWHRLVVTRTIDDPGVSGRRWL